jgi:serine phosphatase RsbU (regulator of sigma subunit)
MNKFLSILFLIPYIIFGQQKKIDSLNLVLNKAKHDTTKMVILLKLAEATDNDSIMLSYNEKGYNFALKLSENSSEVISKRGKKGLADAYLKFGLIAKNKDDISKALEMFEKGLKLRQELNDQKGIANSLNNIGLLFDNQGDKAKALDYYAKSLKIREDIGDKKGVSASLNNIGIIYKDQGDRIKALDYFTRSLKLKQEIGDKKGIASSYINIGTIYKEQENVLKALDCYNNSIKIQEEIGDKKGLATSLNNIGAVYYYQQNLEEALVYYFKSFKIREELHDKRGLATSLINISQIYYKQKKYSEANDYCVKSLLLSKELGFPEKIQVAEEMLSQIETEKGNFKAALEHYKQYIIFRDSTNNEGTRKATIKNQLKYEYDKKMLADSVKGQEEKKVISAQLKEEKTKGYALYGGVVLLIIFSLFVFNRFKISQKQKLIIQKQKHIVEEKHKEITDSINYAERIQRSFIATKEVLDENLSDYFVFFKPKDVVSGDFYWANKLKNGNFALATADSTGHGVPGAIMSLLNITSLEKAIETLNNPSDILNATRKTIIERLKKDGSAEGGKDGMDASLTVYDFKNNKLIVAAANNPVWIVRGTEVIEIKADKMPVGKHDKDSVSFTQQEIDLQTGDVIYTLTDGFPDQFGGEKGKKFMNKNLRELLAANAHLPMQQQKELLESTFKNWVNNLEQVDDVTIIGVRF